MTMTNRILMGGFTLVDFLGANVGWRNITIGGKLFRSGTGMLHFKFVNPDLNNKDVVSVVAMRTVIQRLDYQEFLAITTVSVDEREWGKKGEGLMYV